MKAGVCTGITLLHVQFHDRLPAATMRGVLQGYDLTEEPDFWPAVEKTPEGLRIVPAGAPTS